GQSVRMTPHSNAVGGPATLFRICGAMPSCEKSAPLECDGRCLIFTTPPSSRICVTAPPQTEPTISPKPKEPATTSRGRGLHVNLVGGVYSTGRFTPSLSFRSRNTQEA